MKDKVCLAVFLFFLLPTCSSPMATLTPAIESSNSPTPVPTLEKTPTKAQTATVQPELFLLTATFEALRKDCDVLRNDPSPDGRWVAIKCDHYKMIDSEEASTTLRIIHLETLQEWIVSYFQLYGEKELEIAGNMSDGTIFPINWSADGAHLYIGVMPQVFREYYYNRTAALFELNLETGERMEILDVGEIQKTFYDYSLSHDESKIVFVDLLKKPLQLSVKTFDTTETRSVQLDSKFASAGSIVWAQDDNSLIFLAVNFSGNSVLSTLYKWDLQSGELTEMSQLPDMLGRLFFILEWNENKNFVMLKNYHAEEFFKIDLSTGEISKEG